MLTAGIAQKRPGQRVVQLRIVGEQPFGTFARCGDLPLDITFELFVVLLYPGKLDGIPLGTLRQRHRLHVFAFEQEPQRPVVIDGEHMVEVVRIVFHVPAHVCVLTEPRIEAVVGTAGAEQLHVQTRTLEGVLVARFCSEIQKVLLQRKLQTPFGRNRGPQFQILLALGGTFRGDDLLDLRTAAGLVGKLLATQIQRVDVRLAILVRGDAEPRPVPAILAIGFVQIFEIPLDRLRFRIADFCGRNLVADDLVERKHRFQRIAVALHLVRAVAPTE